MVYNFENLHKITFNMTSKIFNILCCLGFILVFSACSKDEENNTSEIDLALTEALINASNGKGLSHFQLPKSNDFNSIPQDPRNKLTPVKIALGQLLYHETGLGMAAKLSEGMGTYSCASCHFASAGFQAGRAQGIADGGIGFGINGEGRQRNPAYPADSLDVQPIRTPTVLNTAYQEAMLWNGQFAGTAINAGTEDNWTEGTPKATNHLGYQGLETQAIAGLGVHRLQITGNTLCEDSYQELFDAAFQDFPAEGRISKVTAGLAIAAYERTILASEAPFQQWLRGNEDAMTETEKRGALVFFNEGNCTSCHTGPALSSMEFHALGMKELNDVEDVMIFKTTDEDGERLGRGGFTQKEEDNYKFKVPQLYNLTGSPFYGHGSSFRSIREIIEYKNQAIPENSNVPVSQLADQFVPLNLTDAQIDDLVVFLSSSLHDPNLNRFEPSFLSSGQCFPNNDAASKADLGCD